MKRGSNQSAGLCEQSPPYRVGGNSSPSPRGEGRDPSLAGAGEGGRRPGEGRADKNKSSGEGGRSANQLTCLDLFCGCGGFSLGMQRAGFRILAAIDFNPDAVATFRTNLPAVPHALERDFTAYGALN